MITQKLHPIFGDKHKEYITRAHDSIVSVAEGAVRAGKTIDNVAAFAKEINSGTPDRVHLVTGSTAATAKLNVGDSNGYGLEHIFRGRCKWTTYRSNEALLIKVGGRDYAVIFAGGSKASSFKRIRGNSYGMWLATEINLHHEDMIKEALNRQLAARNRKVFWDLNPSAPGNWIYERYIDKFDDQFGDKYNYQHFTIRDNLTIDDERFREIEMQYEPGSIWYRRDILGERCNAEGLVYPMFSREQNVAEEHGTEGEWYLSMDYGTLNPTAMGLWRVDDYGYTMEREYYYDGRKEMRQKTDEEYYKDLEAFVGDVPIRYIIIDPSAASFKACIQQHGKFRVRDADNAVIDGIRTTGTRIAQGTIKIHSSCTNTINELGMYRWDETKPYDAVVKENDHSMDQMRYLCQTLRTKATYNENLIGGI